MESVEWKKALGHKGWCDCYNVMRAGGKWATVKEGYEMLKLIFSSSVSSPEPYHQRGPRILKKYGNKTQIKIILSLLDFNPNTNI